MSEGMRLCPFCKSEGRDMRFDDTTSWTGRGSQHICTTLRHWCKREEDTFVDTGITIRARDKEDCIRVWNNE